jgi:hypothetical protein
MLSDVGVQGQDVVEEWLFFWLRALQTVRQCWGKDPI